MNAEVLVKFKGDTENLDRETKKASGSLKGFANGVSTAFKVATGVIAGTTLAIGGLVKKSVEAYAEFEQLEGGLESLFGKGSDEMNKIIEQSEQAYKDLTMSQNEYLNAFEKSYPLVNAGLKEGADSIKYTNKMLQLSSDLYNTYGGSVENYQNAINWALKGSFVYLDNLNLGIKGTQEGFIEAANASGVLSKNITDVKELTNDEIIDVIQHYAEAYGVWGKTGDEASKTILGSLNMTKAAWSNFITGLSKDNADIDGLIDNVVNSALKFGENIVPVIMRAIKSITKALPKVAKEIGAYLPQLVNDLLPPLIETANALLIALLQALPGLLNALIPALINGVVMIIQSLAQTLPTLIPQLITAILDAILMLLDNIELLIDCGMQLMDGLLDGILKAIPKIIEKLPEIIEKLINAFISEFPKLIMLGPKFNLQLALGILKALPQLIAKMPEIIAGMVKGLREGLSSIFNVGKDLIKGLWNGISNVTSWIIGKIKGFGKSVMSAIKGIFGVHSPSTEFEWVGKMNILGLEKGMEEMQPQLQRTINGMFDLQPNVSGTMQSTYSPQMNVIVNNNMEVDPLGQLVNKVKTFSGGAKNDYNWGSGL